MCDVSIYTIQMWVIGRVVNLNSTKYEIIVNASIRKLSGRFQLPVPYVKGRVISKGKSCQT